jgi:hypothetical protein
MAAKMRRAVFRRKVRQLKAFLCPEGKPDRLVQDWNQEAEDAHGKRTLPIRSDAMRFCVLGGSKAVWGWGTPGYGELQTRLVAYAERAGFDLTEGHRRYDVVSFLDHAAEEA